MTAIAKPKKAKKSSRHSSRKVLPGSVVLPYNKECLVSPEEGKKLSDEFHALLAETAKLGMSSDVHSNQEMLGIEWDMDDQPDFYIPPEEESLESREAHRDEIQSQIADFHAMIEETAKLNIVPFDAGDLIHSMREKEY